MTNQSNETDEPAEAHPQPQQASAKSLIVVSVLFVALIGLILAGSQIRQFLTG
jgi:hypothetical protein